MRIPLCLSVLAVLLAPIAHAQDENVITDPMLDAFPPPANAYGDITRGSWAVDGEVVRFTIGLASFPDMTPGVAYVFLWKHAGREMFAAAFTAPTLEYAYGPWDGGPGEFVPASGGGLVTGVGGGEAWIDVPLHAFGNATALTAPRAYALDIKPNVGGGPILFLDEAEGAGELALPMNATAPGGEPAEEATPAAAPVEPGPAAAPAASAEKATPLGAALGLAALVLAFAMRRR